jgi:methylthioribose-1-phosphate isomerase
MDKLPVALVTWSASPSVQALTVIDRRALPGAVHADEIVDLAGVCAAIDDGRISGGDDCTLAVAYGLALHALRASVALPTGARGGDLEPSLAAGRERLAALNPVLASVVWALDRLRDCADRHAHQLTARELAARLLMEARRIERATTEHAGRVAELAARRLAAGTVWCGTGAPVRALVLAREAGMQVSALLAHDDGYAAAILTAAGVPVERATPTALPARLNLAAVGLLAADRVCADASVLTASGPALNAALASRLPLLAAAPSPSVSLGCADAAPHSGLTDSTVIPASRIAALITERSVLDRPSASTLTALCDDRRGTQGD